MLHVLHDVDACVKAGKIHNARTMRQTDMQSKLQAHHGSHAPWVIIKTDLQLVHLAAGYAREHAWDASLLPGPEQAKYLNSKGRCNITPWEKLVWLPVCLYA